MKQKKLMKPRGIGKKEENRIYRDLEGNSDGILYVEDSRSKLLFREVLEQDVDFVNEAISTISQEIFFPIISENERNCQYIRADKCLLPDNRKTIKEDIKRGHEEGEFSIIVFNMYTEEFLCIIDVETQLGTEGRQGIITMAFSKNKVLRKRYEKIIRSRFNEICRVSGLFVDGCKQRIYIGPKSKLIPIS